MRIRIAGENEAAAELRGLLRHEGYLVTDENPTHSLFLDEDRFLAGQFVIDGTDCPLEKRILEHIHALTGKNFFMARVGGIQNDRELRVGFHPDDSHSVALGAFRGLLEVIQRDAKLAMESALPEQMARAIAEGYWKEFSAQVRLGVEASLKASLAASLAGLLEEVRNYRRDAETQSGAIYQQLKQQANQAFTRGDEHSRFLKALTEEVIRLAALLKARLNRPWWKFWRNQ